MGILRTDRITGLGGANAITGSVSFETGRNRPIFLKIASDDFAVGTGDFTLECWYYKSGLGTHNDAVGNIIMQTGNQNGQNGIWLADAQGKLEGRVHYGSGSWNLDITSSSSMVNDRWYHVAMSRSGSTVRIFIDGTLEASGSSSSDLTTAYSNEAYIGGQGNSTGNRGIIGFVSNARISDTALYTATFTAPTTRLEKLSSTLLLCCQSPGNVLQEATGKTIQTYVNNTNVKGPQASRKTPNSPVGFSTTTDVGSQYGTTFDGFGSFATSTYMVPPGGNTRERGRGRAVLSGGLTNPVSDGTKTMEFLNIQSGGITQDFGQLSEERKYSAGLASPTRGVIGGSDGNPAWVTGTMEFVTIANTSNTTTFGNMTAAGGMVSAHSNDTRGLFFGVWDASGSGPAHKGHIDYITIATAGNSADFGQLSVNRPETAGFGSPTRGICAGGYPAADGTTMSNVIDYVTISTLGNATDFGDLTQARQAVSSSSSQTRGLVAGGYIYGSPSITYGVNTIDFVTIATTGNASDFGDLTVASSGKNAGSSSDQIRGIFAGGRTGAGASEINTIDFVTIAATGHASDFGDMTRSRQYGSVMCDSHGGLS